MLCLAVSCAPLTARAFTAADADTVFDAHAKAFYQEKEVDCAVHESSRRAGHLLAVVAEKRRGRVASPPRIGQSFLVPLAAANTGGSKVFVELQQCGGAHAGCSSAEDGRKLKMKQMIVIDR